MFALKTDTHVSPVAEHSHQIWFSTFFGFQVISFCRTDGRTNGHTGELTKPVMGPIKTTTYRPSKVEIKHISFSNTFKQATFLTIWSHGAASDFEFVFEKCAGISGALRATLG